MPTIVRSTAASRRPASRPPADSGRSRPPTSHGVLVSSNATNPSTMRLRAGPDQHRLPPQRCRRVDRPILRHRHRPRPHAGHALTFAKGSPGGERERVCVAAGITGGRGAGGRSPTDATASRAASRSFSARSRSVSPAGSSGGVNSIRHPPIPSGPSRRSTPPTLLRRPVNSTSTSTLPPDQQRGARCVGRPERQRRVPAACSATYALACRPCSVPRGRRFLAVVRFGLVVQREAPGEPPEHRRPACGPALRGETPGPPALSAASASISSAAAPQERRDHGQLVGRLDLPRPALEPQHLEPDLLESGRQLVPLRPADLFGHARHQFPHRLGTGAGGQAGHRRQATHPAGGYPAIALPAAGPPAPGSGPTTGRASGSATAPPAGALRSSPVDLDARTGATQSLGWKTPPFGRVHLHHARLQQAVQDVRRCPAPRSAPAGRPPRAGTSSGAGLRAAPPGLQQFLPLARPEQSQMHRDRQKRRQVQRVSQRDAGVKPVARRRPDGVGEQAAAVRVEHVTPLFQDLLR